MNPENPFSDGTTIVGISASLVGILDQWRRWHSARQERADIQGADMGLTQEEILLLAAIKSAVDQSVKLLGDLCTAHNEQERQGRDNADAIREHLREQSEELRALLDAGVGSIRAEVGRIDAEVLELKRYRDTRGKGGG